MALNGLNFELRNVRPADDAKLYSTIYTDGRMTACALTYSGANLTIAKGVLMVKGRMIALDNDETVATVPTYANGFGRIKLKIDLSQAPSASTFTQGSLICEYASTNSFSALTQDDINDGVSTVYEIEICRLQYASGSISAIVSQVADATHDYIYWQGNVSAYNSLAEGYDTWYVRKWRSGRIEADIRIQAINSDALTYTEVNGVYRATVVEYGVKFPYSMASGMLMHAHVRGMRTGLMYQDVVYSGTGITKIDIWSPSTEAFAVTGSMYMDLFIHIEGATT